MQIKVIPETSHDLDQPSKEKVVIWKEEFIQIKFSNVFENFSRLKGSYVNLIQALRRHRLIKKSNKGKVFQRQSIIHTGMECQNHIGIGGKCIKRKRLLSFLLW